MACFSVFSNQSQFWSHIPHQAGAWTPELELRHHDNPVIIITVVLKI